MSIIAIIKFVFDNSSNYLNSLRDLHYPYFINNDLYYFIFIFTYIVYIFFILMKLNPVCSSSFERSPMSVEKRNWPRGGKTSRSWIRRRIIWFARSSQGRKTFASSYQLSNTIECNRARCQLRILGYKQKESILKNCMLNLREILKSKKNKRKNLII